MGDADSGNAEIMGRETEALLTPLLIERLGLGGVGQDRHLAHAPERLFEQGIGPRKIDFGLSSFHLANDVQAPPEEFFDHSLLD